MNEKNKFTIEYKNKYFTIEKTINNMENGDPYYRINTNNSVICCLLDLCGNLVYVKQFRPNLGYFTIEMPSGYIEDNELPGLAVSREIMEEVGIEADFIYLGTYRVNMNRNTNKEFIYLALQKNNIKYKNEPDIETVTIKRSELRKLIAEESSFEHIISYAIFQIVNIKLKIDLLNDSYTKIKEIFYTEICELQIKK
jgi:8-oxo-dGTP pyrophosphatase MutT (NUDIX family)